MVGSAVDVGGEEEEVVVVVVVGGDGGEMHEREFGLREVEKAGFVFGKCFEYRSPIWCTYARSSLESEPSWSFQLQR